MSFIFGIVIVIFICGLLPFALGVLPVSFSSPIHKSLTAVWVAGWIAMLAICEIVMVPFVVLQLKFTLTAWIFSAVLFVMAIVSMIIARKDIKTYYCKLIKKKNLQMDETWGIEDSGKGYVWLKVIVLLIILVQLAAAVFMQYLDGDDSFYIAASLTSQHTDSMYIFNPYMGAHGSFDIRHALSPLPMFLAWLSTLTGIHITIMCHSIISVFLITLRCCVVYLLAYELFAESARNRWLFMLFVNVWYLFGNVSIYTAESFAYTRTWQGKSIFPNIIIPCLFTYLLMIAKNTTNLGEWCMIFLLTLAGICTTSVAIFLMPILTLVAVIFIAVTQKRLVVLAQSLACLLPGAFFGMLYIFLH